MFVQEMLQVGVNAIHALICARVQDVRKNGLTGKLPTLVSTTRFALTRFQSGTQNVTMLCTYVTYTGDSASRRECDNSVNMRPSTRRSQERVDRRVTDPSVEDQIKQLSRLVSNVQKSVRRIDIDANARHFRGKY